MLVFHTDLPHAINVTRNVKIELFNGGMTLKKNPQKVRTFPLGIEKHLSWYTYRNAQCVIHFNMKAAK